MTQFKKISFSMVEHWERQAASSHPTGRNEPEPLSVYHSVL